MKDSTKIEVIDEINDILEDLSPMEAWKMFGKLTYSELLNLHISLELAIKNAGKLKNPDDSFTDE